MTVTDTRAGTPLLSVRDLVTRYPLRGSAFRARRWARAVDGISFDVRAGEMVALVGESGCGKTTTAQSVLRMVEPAEGRVLLDGRDITHLSDRDLRPLRREMQMVYQDPYESLDPRFKAWQTVEEPLLVHGIGGSRKERRVLVDEALERVGLSPAELFAATPDLLGEQDVVSIPGAPPRLDRPITGCAFAPRCPHSFERCTRETPTLLGVDGEEHRAACHLNNHSFHRTEVPA